MLRELGPTCFLTATRPPTTAPIPPYAPGMDGSKLNALFAEMTPDEIEFIPRGVDAWLRSGWMDQAEADQWRRRILAWQAFLALGELTEG